MAALTLQHLSDAGTKPPTVVPTASDTVSVANGKNVFLVYRNTSATSVTVTVVHQGTTTYNVAKPDNAVVCPITTGEVWIPIRKEYDDGTGNATITTSAQPAGLTVAAVQLDFAS